MTVFHLLSHRLVLAFALVAAALAALPLLHGTERAAAHPLGNFTINRYSRIELSPQEVRLRYVLDLAEIPAFQERQTIDRDGDGAVSDPERSAHLASKGDELHGNLRLTVDGKAVQLRAVSSDLSFPPGQGGLDTQRVVIDFAASMPDGWAQTARRVEYRDGNYDERIGWREVVVRSLDGVRVFNSSVPSEDVSDELRAYPKDGLSNPLSVSSATFQVAPGSASFVEGGPGPQRASETHARAVRGNSDSPLARYADLIARDKLSLGVVVLALVAAVGFGALHALSPGHGKTVVAAYLIGSRGTARHALLLGLTVTATHTSSVYALGFVTLYLSDYILPEDLYPWLGIISGGLIVAMGLSLFIGRLRASRLLPDVLAWLRVRIGTAAWARPRGLALAAAETGAGAIGLPPAGAATGRPGHAHAKRLGQELSGGHRHGLGPEHSHAAAGAGGNEVSWRSLIGLGMFGGMLPCPSAIVVMLSAIALHRVAFGLLLIVAFSFGLAAVLTGIGFVLVYAGRLSDRTPLVRAIAAHLERGSSLASFAVRAFPAGSAAIVASAGLVIMLRSLVQQGFL